MWIEVTALTALFTLLGAILVGLVKVSVTTGKTLSQVAATSTRNEELWQIIKQHAEQHDEMWKTMGQHSVKIARIEEWKSGFAIGAMQGRQEKP